MKSVTTLVAVVDCAAADTVAVVARAASNVTAEQIGELPLDPVQATTRVREVWSRAATHSAIYTLVDADPLAVVVAHWAARLQGEDHDLELAIGLAGDLSMPDYYLVDTELMAPAVDWYLGLMERLGPARVVPVQMNPPSLLGALSSLPYGRAFPPAAEVAARARDFVPVPEVVPVAPADGGGARRSPGAPVAG